MFVALQSHEKFPEEGFDVDVQSEWWIFFPKCLESYYLFWYDHLGKGIEKMVSFDKTVIFGFWKLHSANGTVSFGFSDRSDENDNLLKYKL